MRALKKIQEFRLFNDGWSFGEGKSFNEKVIKRATELIKLAKRYGFTKDNAFPGLNGDIMVTIYKGNSCWEFKIDEKDKIIYAYEENNKDIDYIENMPFKRAIEIIKEIAIKSKLDTIVENKYKIIHDERKKWKLSELFTSDISMKKPEQSGVQPFKIHQDKEVSQFSVKNVQTIKEETRVHTSINSTHHQLVVFP